MRHFCCRLIVSAWLWAMALDAAQVQAAVPRVLLEGAKLELIGVEPAIVTPVGMTFDAQGRLLVIESHTHERPENYEGPAGDRIRMLADSNGDGQLDRWSTFAEDFHQSMNLLAAGPGQVYLVTRRSVELLIDDDHDGRMDRQQRILWLETEDDYPHNALGGIAHDGAGGLYIGLGENHGIGYTLTGSDGSEHRDHGGVGTIFHCTAEGKNLRRFCNGFWNPFAICLSPDGQVFTVDNDPDSSPPCRLIHAVETGDYGHRYEYSRAGIHPLQAWDGELPGTLPMLAGTGEAPCAVVPHRGALWVTSWGDHRLECYTLRNNGGTYLAEQTIAVQGDSDFRPTGCAVAPDGSLYFTDWVSHSYPVHKQGRIWRLSFANNSGAQLPVNETIRQVNSQLLRTREDFQDLARSSDRFVRQLAVNSWNQAEQRWPNTLLDGDGSSYLVMLQAKRWHYSHRDEPTDEEVSLLREALRHESHDVRLYAMRWIADERMQTLRDDIEGLLDGTIPDERYYLSVLSALEWLDGEPTLRNAALNDGLLVRELKNQARSPQQHALALRSISPDNKFLTFQRIAAYLRADYEPLRLEAVRTLALKTDPARFQLLKEVANDADQSSQIRAEAIAGLAADDDAKDTLAALSNDSNDVIQKEARRVQRLAGLTDVSDEQKPPVTDLPAWNRLLADSGNAEAGRRLFFSSRGARCGVCHQHSGRGGKIGPDLTHINRSNTREQLIASILQPSREMAPHYVPWVLQTDAGKSLVVLRLHKAGDSGKEIYADTQGEMIQLSGDEIEFRQASDVSIMPAGLEKTVSIDQLRDLVEFLSTGG